MSIREEEEVFSRSFYKEASTASALNKISTTIVLYRGSVKNPRWMDAEPGEHMPSPFACSVSVALTARGHRAICHSLYDLRRHDSGQEGEEEARRCHVLYAGLQGRSPLWTHGAESTDKLDRRREFLSARFIVVCVAERSLRGILGQREEVNDTIRCILRCSFTDERWFQGACQNRLRRRYGGQRVVDSRRYYMRFIPAAQSRRRFDCYLPSALQCATEWLYARRAREPSDSSGGISLLLYSLLL